MTSTVSHNTPPRDTLHLHEVSEGSWEVVGMDLVTRLPLCKGYDAIATYINHYSKQVHIISTTTEVDAEGITDLYYQEIFRLHRVPKKIISDGSPQYADKRGSNSAR